MSNFLATEQPTKYRKKPVEIEAVQWTGRNREVISRFLGSADHSFVWDDLIIHTLEGDMEAGPGSFIIKGVSGEFYPCDSLIFEYTYDPVEPPL